MASTGMIPSFRAFTASARASSSRQIRSLTTVPSRILPSATPRRTSLASTIPQRIIIPLSLTTTRFSHSIPRPPRVAEAAEAAEAASLRKEIHVPKQPSYELTFTCVPCGTRSAHNVSKQGYHHGSVLIACPSCRNRHVISDHLNIFGDRKITVEDLMKERGRLVKRGTLGEEGDLEFWEDGSTTVRNERQGDGEGMDPKPKPRVEGDSADGKAPGSTFGKA